MSCYYKKCKLERGDNIDFPEILKTLRERSELSQNALAKIIGVSQASIGYWEKGQRTPAISAAEKLVSYFGVTTTYLLGMETSNYSLLPNEIGLLHNYRILNEIGKDKVVEYTKDLTKIPEYQKSPLTERQTLNAAHAMEGASKEDMEHDETIMNDDSEWQ